MERQKVGPIINFRGLTYAPVNEQGVVFLFGKVNDDLGIKIESVQVGFPDAIGIDYRHRTDEGVRKRIEFEFHSSNYDHPLDGCDIIVCWDHDWKECPESIEVIALKNEIGKLGAVHSVLPMAVEKFIELRKPNKDIEEVFRRLVEEIERMSSEMKRKFKKTTVSYIMRRPVVSLELRKTRVMLHLTLPKKPREKNVKYARTVYGNKSHGHLMVRNLAQVEPAIEICRRALQDALT